MEMEKIIVTNSTFSHTLVTNSEIIIKDVFILKNMGSWGIMVLEKSQEPFWETHFLLKIIVFLVLEQFMFTTQQ